MTALAVSWTFTTSPSHRQRCDGVRSARWATARSAPFRIAVFRSPVANDPVGHQVEALLCGSRRIAFGWGGWVIDEVDALEIRSADAGSG